MMHPAVSVFGDATSVRIVRTEIFNNITNQSGALYTAGGSALLESQTRFYSNNAASDKTVDAVNFYNYDCLTDSLYNA